MNKLNFQELRKHPIKTVGTITSLTALVAIITLKIIHNVPLVNLKDKYLEDFRANGYSLGPIAESFFRVNPKSLFITQISEDTIIVQDVRNLMTFTITCQGNNKYCFVRDNPLIVSATGTVIGKGESISRESVGKFLDQTMNPSAQNI